MDTEISLDGYTKEKIYFNMLWANIFAIIVFVVFATICGGSFYLIWHERINFSINEEMAARGKIILVLKNIAVVLVPILVGCVLHELIHGLFYTFFAKNRFKSIRFGIKPKYGIAYCMCTELIKIKHVIICAAMPTIILGFIPAVFSLIVGSLFWLLFGVMFISAGAGDFLIIVRLLKENKEDYALDTLGEVNCTNIYRKTLAP
jgi:hypothetical protein